MEITFENENSDLIIEFDSDILCENYSDRTAVQWQFYNKTHSSILANVLSISPSNWCQPGCILPGMRLCCRHDEESF